MTLGIVGLSRHSIIPEELTLMVFDTRALTQVRSRYVDAVRIFTALVHIGMTLINVQTSSGRVRVALVTSMAVATV
jgi:hypothetical protein